MMKAIVTGATGFLGKHLCNELSHQGWKVIALGRNREIGTRLSNSNVSFKYIDLEDNAGLSRVFEHADIIFHCAAFSSAWGNKNKFYSNNVTVTKNILLCAEKYKINKIIHISSTSVYFDFTDRLNISETDSVSERFVNAYAETKYLSEKVLLDDANTNIEKVIIRPRGIIGEGDNAIMPRILRVAEKGTFPLFNNGNTLLDITYVKNVVDAMLLCGTTNNIDGEVFNISNDEPRKIASILDAVFRELDLNVKLKHAPYSLFLGIANILEGWAKITKGNEPILTKYGVGLLGNSQTLNINKAKNILSYKPSYTLDEGISCYAEWQKNK